MYITEVWEMDRLSRGNSEQRIQLKFARHKNQTARHAIIPKWYEVYFESDRLCQALTQNQELELGDEVNWNTEELLKSGVLDNLVRKGADVVKKIDGVGYWNDNHENDLLRSALPPPKLIEESEEAFLQKFW